MAVLVEGRIKDMPQKGPAGKYAAREVMLQYMETMSGDTRDHAEHMHPTLRAYFSEYTTVPASYRQPQTRAQALRYVDDLEFRKVILAKNVPPEFQQEYWVSPAGQAVIARANAARPEVVAVRKDLADNAPSGAEANQTAFGIPLGAPLSLPGCTMGQIMGATSINGTSSGVPGPTCMMEGGLGALGASVMVESFRVPTGVQQVVVRLGKDACPNWVFECTLLVAVAEGYALGVVFETTRSPVDALTKKYGKSTGQESTACTSGLKSESTLWNKPDLYVSYNPFSPRSCTRGFVQVQTKAYQARMKRIEDSGPQM